MIIRVGQRNRKIQAGAPHAMAIALVAGLLSGGLPAIAQPSPAKSGAASLGPGSSGSFVVSGVILDPSEAAIVGSKVTLRGAGREASATADMTGAFRFAGLSAGTYELQAEAAGFRAAKARVKVGRGPVAPARMILSINQVYEEVTVSSGMHQLNTEVSGNLDVITLDRKMLDSLPIQGNDVLGAIARLAGASGGLTVVVDGIV